MTGHFVRWLQEERKRSLLSAAAHTTAGYCDQNPYGIGIMATLILTGVRYLHYLDHGIAVHRLHIKKKISWYRIMKREHSMPEISKDCNSTIE